MTAQPPAPSQGILEVHPRGFGFLRDQARHFVARPKEGPLCEETKQLIRRLLLERLVLRAIARATGVSWSWLQRFGNEPYRESTPWGSGQLKAKSAAPTGVPSFQRAVGRTV